LLALHNARRSRPLQIHPALARSAQGWADEMARTGFLAHGDFAGRIRAAGFSGTTEGENIAEGQQTVDQVFAAWWSDLPHRRNLLDASFAFVGFGRAVGAGGRVFWVADFGG
jgi:uncharacterized protein YkwD